MVCEGTHAGASSGRPPIPERPITLAVSAPPSGAVPSHGGSTRLGVAEARQAFTAGGVGKVPVKG